MRTETGTYDEKRGASLPIFVEKNEDFSRHNERMYKFILVKSGTGIVKLNGKKSVLMTPAVLCLNERDVLELEEQKDLDAKSICFEPIIVNDVLTIEHINDDKYVLSDSENRDYYLLVPFFTRNETNTGMIHIDMITAQRINGFLKSLEMELETLSNGFWRCRSRSFFLEILFFIQYLWTEADTAKSFEIQGDSTIANKILMYLHVNYEKKLTLKQLSDMFHVNRTTLTEEFQKATNLTIIEYLIKLRVHMAMIMIKSTALPINEIMFRTGFNDITHFGRTFKKHTGYSPSEYRINV